MATAPRGAILVVDDEPTIAEVVGRYLERASYSTRSVGDGKQALELARADPPDLVVLDLMLPGIGGLELLRRRDAMFEFLRALGLDPLEWEELVATTGSAMPYSGEAVEQGFRQAQAVVVLFSPDDEARLHPDLHGCQGEPEHERELTGQPRANVILEAGLAVATHPDRTIVVEVGDLRPISNLSGRNVVRFAGTTDHLNTLAGRLERAGCHVRRDRGDWLDTKRFTALPALKRQPIRYAAQ